MWDGVVIGMFIGGLCAGFFWLGTHVQRKVPFVVRTSTRHDEVHYENIEPPKGSWGGTLDHGPMPPQTNQRPRVGYANPMGPPPAPPDKKPGRMPWKSPLPRQPFAPM